MGAFIRYDDIMINGVRHTLPVMTDNSAWDDSMLGVTIPFVADLPSGSIIPIPDSGFSFRFGNDNNRMVGTLSGNGWSVQFIDSTDVVRSTGTIVPFSLSGREEARYGLILTEYDGVYTLWYATVGVKERGDVYAVIDTYPQVGVLGTLRMTAHTSVTNYRTTFLSFPHVPLGYTVTYQTNGGSPVDPLENVTALPDPLPTTTFPGFVFLGWYTDSSLIFPAIPGSPISQDTTLYAGWRREYPGPGSETGGGEGAYDDSSDDIETAAPPLTDVTNTKFLTLWEATSTQLDTLAADLWSNAFNTGIFKNQRDPFEALISLHQMPLPPDQIAAGNIKIGNYEPNPAIQMTRIKQYKTLYCGSVEVPEYWGNALDYNGGGTRLEIYLPYIGTRELDPDDFVGGRCHVTYTVDMLTGACVAQVRANRTDPDSGHIDSVLYVYSGVCGVEIPLSGSSHSVTVGNIISGIAAAGGAVVSVATGGMALPALGAVAGAAGSIAANANKTHVSRSGGVSQNAGIMSPQKPYLIISRPVQQTPDQIKRFSGFPAYVTGPLSGFSGFTKVFRVHVDVTATEAERDEIERLLKQGVIL